MSCHLDNLPSEVKEKIMIYCDGTSLGNLIKTSKRWKELIETSNKFTSKKWSSVCMHEMKQDFIIDILQNLYPKYWLDEEISWKAVYTCWRKWNRINYWTPTVSTFLKKTRNCVSSIKFSGNWIFIATKNEGVLEAVNYITREKLLLYQCNSIEDIYMRCHIKKEESDNLIMENVEHDEVVMQLLHHYIFFDLHTGQTRILPKLYKFLTLKHFESQEVSVTNMSSPSIVRNLNVSNDKKIVVKRKEWVISNVVQVWNGNILLLDYNERSDKIATFEVTDYNFKTVDHPLTHYKVHMFEFLHYSMKNYHLGVMIILKGAELQIIVDGRTRKYQTFFLDCQILCTHYYAGQLFLGSSTGIIYIYRVSCDLDLLSLNLSNYECYLDICSEPILAIDVRESIFKPIIAAGSEHNIYLIRKDKYITLTSQPGHHRIRFRNKISFG
ncbi:unnamed protein product [Nezara viridula]|uniref:F-box domain-containing protein n=1 Tax=Nezara viridula TaxID=85310 RepID=A0A9P0HPN4_NEZVI|nr:unnamed protein product [Nezara viridula]